MSNSFHLCEDKTKPLLNIKQFIKSKWKKLVNQNKQKTRRKSCINDMFGGVHPFEARHHNLMIF